MRTDLLEYVSSTCNCTQSVNRTDYFLSKEAKEHAQLMTARYMPASYLGVCFSVPEAPPNSELEGVRNT